MVFGVYSMWFTEKKGNLNLLPEFGILENCKWSGACRKNYGFSKKGAETERGNCFTTYN